MHLNVTARQENDVIVLNFEGEVDAVTAPQMRDAIATILARGHHRIVCDLTGVSFMDSTGLGVLVGRLKAVRMLEGRMRVVICSERILKNFEITGLSKIFDIDPDVKTALKNIAK